MFDARIRAPANVVDRPEARKLTWSKRANLPLGSSHLGWEGGRRPQGSFSGSARPLREFLLGGSFCDGARPSASGLRVTRIAPRRSPCEGPLGPPAPRPGLGGEWYVGPLVSKSEWPVGVHIVSRTCPG
jgi:hypothetical protein